MGNDTMTGGAGSDVFLFNSPADRGDRITDFHHNEDHLTFAAAGFANLDDDFALSVGAHPAATSGTETFLFYTGSHNLYYDADGNGAGSAVFVTALDHISSLSKSDFSIV